MTAKKTTAVAPAAPEPEPPALPGQAAPPAYLQERLAADAGKGVSHRQEDNLIPIIYVLQSQSPQVLRRNPAFIEGAEAGFLWLRNSPLPLINGEEGVAFQPCYFNIDYVEWLPRDSGGGSGGGFIARHLKLPDDAQKMVDERNPNKVWWVRENGNEIIETRNHYGFILGGLYALKEWPKAVWPFMIPLSNSGHSVSRSWMTLMNQFFGPNGEEPVSFSRYYHLTTKLRTNSQGEWFVINPEDGGWVRSAEEYDRGLALHRAIAAGELKAEAPVENSEDTDSSDRAERSGI